MNGLSQVVATARQKIEEVYSEVGPIGSLKTAWDRSSPSWDDPVREAVDEKLRRPMIAKAEKLSSGLEHVQSLCEAIDDGLQ
ncbi:MAG: hypothetical protein FGM37_01845 [Phycisphaerales bacterium]|nr:hypothetical protein [Phycisphaerales bacterium]